MQHKYFNFLYIPLNNAEPRPIRVRRSLVYGIGVSFCIALTFAAGAVFRYSAKIRHAYEFSNLQRQNAQLLTELGAFEGEIETLKRQVAQNFDFQKKARLLANLDDLSDDVTEVGVGGPDYAYIQSISDLDPETRDRVTGARGGIEKMLRQAELQSGQYGEIIETLQETDDQLRSTPSTRPVNVGFVSSRYGRRMDPITGRRTMHRGIDFSARLGTPVYATADAVVSFSGTWKTYGNVVELSHGNGFVTRFAHLQERLVKKGQRVRRGDLIARVGSTGRSTFSHLHYEVERDGKRVDPLRYVLN